MESWKQKSVLFFVVFGITLDADFDSNNSLIEFYGLSDEKINIVIANLAFPFALRLVLLYNYVYIYI